LSKGSNGCIVGAGGIQKMKKQIMSLAIAVSIGVLGCKGKDAAPSNSANGGN